jgi:hypothetical protein
MSQTSIHLGSPIYWLAVNGSYAVCAVMATVGANPSALIVINLLIALYLLLAFVSAMVPGVLQESAKRAKPTKISMTIDCLYDVAMLTLLCCYAPWYTWMMYLIAAAVSIYNIKRVREYATA